MFSLITFMKSKVLGENPIYNRNLSTGYALREKVPSTSSQPPPATDSTNIHTNKNVHRPNSLEKRFLVWSGKYKTVEDVPAMVSYEALERARSKGRIRIANIMMALTAVACVVMAISGKRAAERGESVQKMNLDWHKEIKEQYVRDQEALAAKGLAPK